MPSPAIPGAPGEGPFIKNKCPPGQILPSAGSHAVLPYAVRPITLWPSLASVADRVMRFRCLASILTSHKSQDSLLIMTKLINGLKGKRGHFAARKGQTESPVSRCSDKQPRNWAQVCCLCDKRRTRWDNCCLDQPSLDRLSHRLGAIPRPQLVHNPLGLPFGSPLTPVHLFADLPVGRSLSD